ncbi:tyrosine-protein phosphatase [Desulfitispora alkaliphila]|uniref:tyrosine-protein phosphatase n=1 Tax=Desulfitispora alkaliphila TaxID=622674 RepID=UPI003D1DF568
MHSHILPEIDDGAQSWDEFMSMVKMASSEGITHMVCSPHYIPWESEFDLEDYHLLLAEARRRVEEQGIGVELIAGCEAFFTSDLLKYLEKGSLVTINQQGKHLLVEFSRGDIPEHAKELLFELKLMGITPIIAHPERNLMFRKKPELLVELIEQGALCQINAGSITGMHSKAAKECAEKFLRADMIHMLGTDAHSPRTRSPKVKEAIARVEGLIGSEKLKEITEINPQKVLNGEEVDPYPVKLNEQKSYTLWRFVSQFVERKKEVITKLCRT